MKPDPFQLVVADLCKAFSQAYLDLKPCVDEHARTRLVDVLHKLRTHTLNLLHEARDA